VSLFQQPVGGGLPGIGIVASFPRGGDQKPDDKHHGNGGCKRQYDADSQGESVAHGHAFIVFNFGAKSRCARAITPPVSGECGFGVEFLLEV